MHLFASKVKTSEEDVYLEALKQAQKEYDMAMCHFDEATEPEIIDEAIFRMKAARKKYSYFLRMYRSQKASAYLEVL